MKILLVNDDGIHSKKLEMTKRILEMYGDVMTIAPAVEQSAKSMSLTFGGAKFEKLNNMIYKVYGTPVDCVNFAMILLEEKPDLLVSGTNNGYNIGIDIRYSGTVGAALQGQYFGIPTIALSSDYHGSEMIDIELKNALDYIFENNLVSNTYTLNVNLPQDSFGKSKGVMETNIYNLMHMFNSKLYDNKYDPKRIYDWDGEVPLDSEQYAYLNGYTSISKVKL